MSLDRIIEALAERMKEDGVFDEAQLDVVFPANPRPAGSWRAGSIPHTDPVDYMRHLIATDESIQQAAAPGVFVRLTENQAGQLVSDLSVLVKACDEIGEDHGEWEGDDSHSLAFEVWDCSPLLRELLAALRDAEVKA